MELRNKKTGEIGYLIVGRGSDHYVVANNEWSSCGKYDSLAELNAEWEDYEEPKEYYFIRDDGSGVGYSPIGNSTVAKRREKIGNYFSSREEAEKAVEKLKAWKRLKDKGFRFNCWYGGSKDMSFSIPQEIIDRATAKDLDLLFGGEE